MTVIKSRTHFNGVTASNRLDFKRSREFWKFGGKGLKNYKFISKLGQKITTLICNFFPKKNPYKEGQKNYK